MARVLLVDDDPLVRRALRRVLAHSGFEIDDVHCANEAIARLMSQSFECVLTDFHLPDHDGLWLLTEARRIQPSAIRILCTGGEVPDEHVARAHRDPREAEPRQTPA